MAMVDCQECGNRWDDSVEESCPVCSSRWEQIDKAKDPTTSPDELGKLALSPFADVSAAALDNPNTPQWAKNRLAATTDSARGGGQPATEGSRPGAPGPGPGYPRGGSGSGSKALMAAASEAKGKARGLMSIAAVLSVLGIVGSILIGIIGLFSLGNEDSRVVGIILIASGSTGVLIWLFIGALAQALAAGVNVLAAFAEDQRRD